MNTRDSSLLKSLGIFCNPDIKKKYDHKHADPDKWVRFYYYKKRKPFLVPISNIRFDAEVSSTNSLHKHTFYKMSHLSKTDLYYDFYYKLKDDVNDCVIKENKRLNKKSKIKNEYKETREIDENGLFVVRFE